MAKKARDLLRNGREPAGRLDDGRDELNLAEFPVAALADRVPRSQKTLVFQDQVWDKGRHQRVTRRLTVSASEKYGLPTALDDEVLVGLVQLTTRTEPPSRTVRFSKYQLIDLLGWRREGKSYRRLEQSLRRWVGVTLYYDKAWWDKAAQSWVNESFHLLEKVTLYDREQRIAQADRGCSSFVWSEVVFRSFQAGYLKRLDLDRYRRLRLAVAKRMYRFLDKRFYHRDRWLFDLREFACEHIGISRNNDIGQLKRRLQPAIRELEGIGVLKPLDRARRYSRVARGKWNILLENGNGRRQSAATAVESEHAFQILVDRGVSRPVAKSLSQQYPADKILEKIELLDTILRADPTSITRPAGFLVEAIRSDYAPLANPSNGAGRSKPSTRPSKRSQRRVKRRESPVNGEELRWAAESTQVEHYLNSLPRERREKTESDAVAQAPLFLRALYFDRLRLGSPQAEWYREQMVRQHVLGRIIQSK